MRGDSCPVQAPRRTCRGAQRPSHSESIPIHHHFNFMPQRDSLPAASVRAVVVKELVRIIIFRQTQDDPSRNQGVDGGFGWPRRELLTLESDK